MPRKPSPQLTEAELRLMNIIWDGGARTVSEIADAIGSNPTLAYNSVLTTLRILENKGFVRHTKQSRAFLYEAVVDRDEARGGAVRHLLSRYFNDSPALLAANLLKNERIRKRDLDKCGCCLLAMGVRRMLETVISTLNTIAAVVAASLVNTAAITSGAVVAAVLVAQCKSWSAASRAGLWWLTLLLVIAEPFGCALLRGKSETTTPTAVMQRAGTTRPGVISPVRIAPSPTRKSIVRLSIPARLLLCWWIASVFQFIRLVRGFQFGLKLKRTPEAAPEHIGVMWQQICERNGMQRPVRLSVSRQLSIPAVVGYREPAVLIPVELASRLNAAELEQVLLHELAHVARYDDWKIAGQRLIETLAVWNPLVRYLAYRLSRDREMACDDFVTAAHAPKHYAACLAKIAQVGPFSTSNAVLVPLLEGKSELVARVEMLLDRSRAHIPRTSVYRLLLASAGFLLLATVGLQVPRIMAMPVQNRNVPVPAADASVAAKNEADEKTSGLSSIVITSESGESSQFGNWSGDSVGEPGTIEFKDGRKLFRIRDKALREQASQIIRPMEELGRRQDVLGEEQSKLGEGQAKLGEEQAKMADRPLESAQAAKLVDELKQMKKQMDELNSKWAEKTASDAQERLGELQSDWAKCNRS